MRIYTYVYVCVRVCETRYIRICTYVRASVIYRSEPDYSETADVEGHMGPCFSDQLSTHKPPITWDYCF